MEQKIKSLKKLAKSILIAVIVASLVRKYFQAGLEDKVVWITFYSVVVVAAILGGFFPGMLSSVFAVLIVLFQWQIFINIPFINEKTGTISIIVFLINCSLISAISEYSRQQKIKANIQKEKAEFASRAKSTFLDNISHELRTPLNAILGFTSLMRENIRIPDDEQKNLKIINRSGEHLLNLINNVLDIAKIEDVINQIQEIDSKAGQTLLVYTKNLKYTEIYRLIKKKNNLRLTIVDLQLTN